MEFGANKTPNGVVKEGAFGGTYFSFILFQYYWKVVQKVTEIT